LRARHAGCEWTNSRCHQLSGDANRQPICAAG
jgi:hypothetical protein